MHNQSSQPVRVFIPVAIVLAGLGWAGLYAVVFYTPPTLGPRWLFFFLCTLAATGTLLPVMAFLNRRFPGSPPATPGVVMRQAVWVGVYVATLAWLQIGRVLTLAIALLLAAGLLIIEWLLRLRERSQWKPDREANG
jgi:hypothetical protein